MRYLALIGIASLPILYLAQHNKRTHQNLSALAKLCLVLGIAHGTWQIGNFLNTPTYESDKIREKLVEIADKNSVIAGGWAPFLTLNTPLKSLYANTDYNTPESLKITQPEYFLLSQTPTALKAFDNLMQDNEIMVGEKINLGHYNNIEVTLHSLDYKNTNSGQEENIRNSQ